MTDESDSDGEEEASEVDFNEEEEEMDMDEDTENENVEKDVCMIEINIYLVIGLLFHILDLQNLMTHVELVFFKLL